MCVTIAKDAFVGPNVVIVGNVVVEDGVLIEDNVIIDGDDKDGIVITGNTHISGDCSITGCVAIHDCVIKDYVQIHGVDVRIENSFLQKTAHVCEKAKIRDAELRGPVTIGGDTVITGGVWAMGNMLEGVFSEPVLWIQGSRYTIGWSGGDLVTSGCITRPIDWWCANLEKCAEREGYTPAQIREYRMYVDLLARHIEERS